MTLHDSQWLSQPPVFPSHRQGLPTENSEAFLQHSTGNSIDLDAFVARHSDDVQLMPIHTNIMRASGLLHGGIAVLDRSRKPRLGDLLAVRYNEAVIMRRLERRTGKYCFVADDPREPIYYVTPDASVMRLGVITHASNGSAQYAESVLSARRTTLRFS